MPRAMGILQRGKDALTYALDDGPVSLSEQVRPEMFLSSDVLRTPKVQICAASHGNAIRERNELSRKTMMG